MNIKSKKGKGIIGITLAAIMIASIFAVIAPSTTADVQPLADIVAQKHTYNCTTGLVDDTLQYGLGDTVCYRMVISNPGPPLNVYNWTGDVYDDYPNSSCVFLDTDLTLKPTGYKMYNTTYVVTAANVAAGTITNWVTATGQNNASMPEWANATAEKINRVWSAELSFDFGFEYICCRNFSFTGTSSWTGSPIVDHKWDFGDGTSTGDISGRPEDYPPVTHQYADGLAGHTRSVTLSGHNALGQSAAYSDDVYIPRDPTAVANANESKVKTGDGAVVKFDCAGSHVDTDPRATGYGLTLIHANAYRWEFYDASGSLPAGTSDDQCETTHVVDGPDGYEVCAKLTVNDTHCDENDTVCVSVWEPSECKLRVYGLLDIGAGDYGVDDPDTEYAPENPPYTDAMAPFYPQAEQAPRKDFITFDPIMMFHNDEDWDNDGVNDMVYKVNIRNDGDDASEKVFKRMWYEPTEWYKDELNYGELDLLLQGGGTITAREAYQCDNSSIWDQIVPFNIDDTKADIYAPSIKQEFTFMMLDSSVCPEPLAAPTGYSSMLIPMATWQSSESIPVSPNGDNGIDSFDMDSPYVPAEVHKVLIESEYSLCMDIDNDNAGVRNPLCRRRGPLEQLDTNLDDLSGDETLVLTSEWTTMEIGDELQFFDHKIVLWDVFGELPVGPEATFLVYYQGETSPPGELRSWPSIAGGETKFFEQGFDNTRTPPGAPGPQGPFFVMVDVVDGVDNKASVKVGRMFGNTHANIGANQYWNQKQFYVDSVCYDVVAIKAVGNESLKYVTFRMKLPKIPIKIPNHTQHLKGWDKEETLPEMPQYNMPHTIVQDVQREWTIPDNICDKIGEYLEVPPLVIEYNEETTEPRFHGELKEILNEYKGKESWMIEWFQTRPYEYTLFRLPPEDEGGIYLLTSAFYAPESLNVLWDGGEPYGKEPIDVWFGKRLKFWYEDCSGPYFVDFDGTLRVYGRLARGAGDPDVYDDMSYGHSTYLHPENPPYTDPMAPFWPQAEEAPDKDFVTFNPIMMYHNDKDWNNDGKEDTVYAQKIRRNFDDASEKIFKRMWYEPTEWYKDEAYGIHDYNGELDLALSDGSTITARELEEDPEALLDLMMSGVTIVPANTPESIYPYNIDADIYAPSIKQEFTFMMLDSSVCPVPAPARTSGGSSMLIPMATWESGNGIDSFDANNDGVPDRVIIDSEAAMIRRNVAPWWFGDNDGVREDLSNDRTALSGDETLILHLDEMTLSLNTEPQPPSYGKELQFFDHKLVLHDVFGDPDKAKFEIFYQGGISPDGLSMGFEEFGVGEVKFFEQGIENTRTPPGAPGPQGPFFVIVTNVDKEENKVSLIVGRMFGETRANVGANMYWNQKQFYVDGVCYNVVAIMTEGERNFKYVTFRMKLPKVPVKIPNHTQHLIAWDDGEILPEMPQFNMPHDILLDVQAGWTYPHDICDKLGPVQGAPALNITWATETEEPRFHGELKEIYYEYGIERQEMIESWMIEWFQTIPYEYTGFDLPTGHGLYLVTSAFYAPAACAYYWDGGLETPPSPTLGARLKFWYDPADPTDIYVTRPPTITTLSIDEYYDRATNGGDADGQVDIEEINKAWSDYVFAFGTGRYPFGEGGIYTAGDLAWMISQLD